MRALAAAALIAAISAATALCAGEVVWGFVAALVLFVALNRVFMPSRYVVGAEEIVIDHPLRRRAIAWRSLSRIAFDDAGALVSGPGFRVSIDFPHQAERVDAIVDAIRSHAVETCAVVARAPRAGTGRGAHERDAGRAGSPERASESGAS